MAIQTVSQLDELKITDKQTIKNSLSSIYIEVSYLDNEEQIMQSKKMALTTLSSVFYDLLQPVIITDILNTNNTWYGSNTFKQNITGVATSAMWA